MTFHSKLGLNEIHRLCNWAYADSDARGAASGFTVDDVGKVAWQQDENSFWVLLSYSPITWGSVAVGGTPGPHATSHKGGGSDAIDNATPSLAGLLSAEDKILLDMLDAGTITKKVFNNTGDTIPRGTLVAVTGWNDVNQCVEVAPADKDTASLRPSIGATYLGILDGELGEVITAGVLSGVDTSSLDLTDQLVLGNDGEFSRPPPDVDPFTGEVQNIGSVTRVHASDGHVLIALDGITPIAATQIFGLAGTDGTPSKTNKYVTNSDSRMTNSRAPTAHASSHVPGASDALSTAAPSDIGTSNTEGNATSFSRSNHVHNLPFNTVASVLGGHELTAGLVYKTDGAGSGDMVLNTQTIRHRVTVGKSGDVNYTSIKTAVDYVNTQSPTKADPWLITVYPGSYTEAPFTLSAGVILVSASSGRDDLVTINASNSAADLITMTGGVINGFLLSGVTDASYCLIRCATPYILNIILNCAVRNCSYGVYSSSGTQTVIQTFGAIIDNVGQAITGAAVYCTGAGTVVSLTAAAITVPTVLIPYYAVNPIEKAVCCESSAAFSCTSSIFAVSSKNTDSVAIYVNSSGRVTCEGLMVLASNIAFGIGPDGTSSVTIAGSSLSGNTINFHSDSSTGVFYAICSVDELKATLVSGSTITGVVQNRDGVQTSLIGDFEYVYPSEREVDIGKFLHANAGNGVLSGGVVTAGTGLHVDVTAGTGLGVRTSPSDVTYCTWDAVTALDILASSTNYVVYNYTTLAVESSTSLGSTSIPLACVVTDGSGIRFLHNISSHIDSLPTTLLQYFVSTRKFVLESGIAVSQGSTARKLTIDSGYYFRGLNRLSFSGSSDMTFSNFYGTNGATEQSGQTQLDITNYDLSGTLTAMTTDYYRSDTLFVTSDNRVSVIMGTSEHASQELAESATTASPPTFMEETACKLAQIIVKKGTGITLIIDRRPVSTGEGSGGGGGGGGGVSVHSLLSGLSADDHTIYLLASGTRSMSGSLNMGGNQITNVGNVDGVDVSGHASRHVPGASDAVTTGTPTGVLVAATAAEGSAASFARSDHQHGIATGTPASVGTANATGSSSSVPRLDHVHDHGSQTSGSLHAVATGSVAGFLSSSDKTKLDGIASGATNTPITSTAPVNVTKGTAAVGVSSEAARQDHKHDITTATPSSVGTGNSEGVAASLARSDHVHDHGSQTSGSLHAVATGSVAGFLSTTDKTKLDGVASGATNTPLASAAPADVTKATAAVGVATTAARADHKHDISTGTPGASAIGDSATEGTATSIARSDHKHSVTSGTPVDVGTANAAGSATTFARSDHVHAGLTRGSGDINSFTSKASPVGDDVLIIEDSAASYAKKKTTISALSSVASIFGADFQSAVADSRTTTTSNTYQDKLTLTTGALTGTYRVGWCADIDMGGSNQIGWARLYNVTDSTILGEQAHRPSSTTIHLPVTGFAYVTFTGSAKTFRIQFRSASSGNTIGIEHANLEFWRVS